MFRVAISQKNSRSTSIPRPLDAQNKSRITASKKNLDKIISNVKTPLLNNSYNIKPNNVTTLNKKILKKPQNEPTTASYSNFAYTPLQTPSHLRNTTASRNDPFGINPLPNIKSPYLSARDPLDFPNLESWGVADSLNYDRNTAYTTMQSQSPLLPMYKLSNKPRKVWH